MKIRFNLIVFFIWALVVSATFNDNKPIGLFKVLKIKYYVENELVGNTVTANSYLYAQNTNSLFIPFNRIFDGDIKLNGKSLFYDNPSKSYYDSSKVINTENIIWSKTEGVYPSFNQSVTIAYPEFNLINRIPNTISKRENLFINLDGNTNICDKIEFTIIDGNNHVINPWYRKLPGNITYINIPKVNLINLETTINGFIIISFINEQKVNLNGRVFLFENRLHIKKKVSITN